MHLRNGATGSVTFLGTVSPAGGNLKEPVTEATQKAARCFYALSQQRADSKRYPAIDPLDSYSKYLEYPEIIEYLDERVEPGWVDLVNRGKTIVQRGKEASEQIDILGDDGVPVEYHDRFWKSELIDFVILQQDAFDAVDANTPLDRQRYMYNLVLDICDRKFGFRRFPELRRVLQIAHQPFQTAQLFRMGERQVRRIPCANRRDGRREGVKQINPSLS